MYPNPMWPAYAYSALVQMLGPLGFGLVLGLDLGLGFGLGAFAR